MKSPARPWRGMARRLALLALALLLLSGCSGKAPAAAAPAAGDAGAAGAADAAAVTTDASGKLSFAAPEWKVGQWWEWQTSFGTQTLDSTYCSIVVAASGSSYTVATESEADAKQEAAFGMPLLGAVGRPDLAMDGWGDEPWSLLSFPLTDGKAWSAKVPNIAWDIVDGPTVDLAMTARIPPPAAGEPPVALIEGKAGDALLVTATYDPAAGWFRDLRFWDVDAGEEGLEIGFHAKSTGVNYTGPIFQATAAPLLDWFDGSGFDDVPTAGGQPFVNPHPYTDFAMEGGEGHLLYGVLLAETVAGGRTVVLVNPNNEARHIEATDSALEGGSNLLWLDEPAIQGMWRIGSAGAGGYSAAYGALFELVVTAGAL
jgi:hypothetical protein